MSSIHQVYRCVGANIGIGRTIQRGCTLSASLPTEEETAMTGTVVYHVTMSLDGFIAGPDHNME
jgi:hypothetical protein